MEERAVMKRYTAQRRSLSTWTGMAIGFRAFYAVMVDGGELFGSAWLAMLMSVLGAVPVGLALKMLRSAAPERTAVAALEEAAGTWGKRLIGLALFAILTYDAGAVVSLMSSTAKYVAMPEANRNLVKLATAAAAVAASLMGTRACADASVLWRRLAAALIVVLVLMQARYFRISWLTPVLGPGIGEVAKNALPAAGIYAFTAAGWLMLEPEHDRTGGAMIRCILFSGLIAAALSLLLGTLIPGMTEAPATRSFRIGRLLTNDRAGLTLEMPYVVLLYSGMLTMLVFELCASANALHMVLNGVEWKACAWTAGGAAFLLSVGRWTDREALKMLSAWYYPVIALPVCLAGLAAWNRSRRKKVQNEENQ